MIATVDLKKGDVLIVASEAGGLEVVLPRGATLNTFTLSDQQAALLGAINRCADDPVFAGEQNAYYLDCVLPPRDQ